MLGATHPNLVRDQGEAYRESLVARVQNSVSRTTSYSSINSSIRPTLLAYISMCDVYVTPYLNEAQMTSGTLAYSFGLGKAVSRRPIGTPGNCLPTDAAYWSHSASGRDRRPRSRIADRRRAAAGDARARLCEQPVHDMGAKRRAPHCRVRKRGGRTGRG